MATEPETHHLGIVLFLRHESVLGDYLHVNLMRWDDKRNRPVGLTSIHELRHLDDLEFGGYVSDYDSQDARTNPDWPYYHGSEARFRSPYEVDASRARVMATFLTKIETALRKADAREHGDRFAIFAKACKARNVWLAKGPDHTFPTSANNWYSNEPAPNSDWLRYSLSHGREEYRRLIRLLQARRREAMPLLPPQSASAA